jgi:hypothetical protein
MPRRLITAALAGALALGALTGCRFESAADAAYVGDTRLTRADVDKVLDAMKADGLNIPDSDLVVRREDIVGSSVFRDVAKRYSQEKGYAAPSVDYDTASQVLMLPPTDPYVRLLAEADAYRTLLLDKVKPVQPTDGDYHDAYELLLSQPLSLGTEAQVKAQLQQSFSQQISTGVALRNELTAAMNRYGTEVNPLYLPSGYPLAAVPTGNGGNAIVVQLPLGGSQQAPVRDLMPTVEPTDDQSAQ